MTSPADGSLAGTTRRKRTGRAGSSFARARRASNSLPPPSVRLATTKTSLTTPSSSARLPQHAAGGGGRRGEDPVHGARHAVLVRTAHHRRHAVEVEHRR